MLLKDNMNRLFTLLSLLCIPGYKHLWADLEICYRNNEITDIKLELNQFVFKSPYKLFVRMSLNPD